MDRDELIKKSSACILSDDNDIKKSCESFINVTANSKEDVKISEEEAETYLKMVGNLKSEDVTKSLKLALDIVNNPDIKNTELRNEASRLIRAIQMS
jgi:predicted Zn-dependent peptidase